MSPSYHKLLMYMSNGAKYSRTNLMRHYPENFERAIREGYIREAGKTDDGESQYVITQKGKDYLRG